MILKRMANALRRQDWTAVILEFVIVIAGVVIGFQVTAWNTERQAQAQRELTLNLLQDEVIENLGVLEGRLTYYEEEMAPKIAVLAEAVSTGELTPADDEDFERALARIQFFAPINMRNAAFDALQQSGDIAALDDPELFVELNRYRAEIDWITLQHTSFRSGISDFGAYIRPYVEHVRDSRPFVTTVRWDLEAMHNDLQTRSAIVEIERMLQIFDGYTKSLHETTADLCEELAARTGRACPAPDAPG